MMSVSNYQYYFYIANKQNTFIMFNAQLLVFSFTYPYKKIYQDG